MVSYPGPCPSYPGVPHDTCGSRPPAPVSRHLANGLNIERRDRVWSVDGGCQHSGRSGNAASSRTVVAATILGLRAVGQSAQLTPLRSDVRNAKNKEKGNAMFTNRQQLMTTNVGYLVLTRAVQKVLGLIFKESTNIIGSLPAPRSSVEA